MIFHQNVTPISASVTFQINVLYDLAVILKLHIESKILWLSICLN